MTQGQVALNLRDMYESVSRPCCVRVGKPSAEEACDKLIVAMRDTGTPGRKSAAYRR